MIIGRMAVDQWLIAVVLVINIFIISIIGRMKKAAPF